MKPAMQLVLILALIAVLVLGGTLSGMIRSPEEKGNLNQSASPASNTTIPGEKIRGYGVFGNITINTEILPASPATFPVYRGIQNQGDNFEYHFRNLGKIRENVTSVPDADRVARKAMIPFGGIPADAIYQGAETTYAEHINFTSNTVESKKPLSTSVSYFQLVNNRGVIGESNWINLELGENDELLYVIKVWRNYTYIGDVPVIPLDKAIRKLEKGETLEAYLDDKMEVTIDTMALTYYAKKVTNNETLLEPFWSFYGWNNRGESIAFNVYARQFANFTATPVSGKSPLTVRFTDTSDLRPNQWFWDFGDGSNSSIQNPVHVYNSTGTYNVTQKVWNDLGSDTMERPYFVTPPPDRLR